MFSDEKVNSSQGVLEAEGAHSLENQFRFAAVDLAFLPNIGAIVGDECIFVAAPGLKTKARVKGRSVADIVVLNEV